MLTRMTRQPGWQLGLLLIGYPVWWLLGLVPFVLLFTAVSLALELRRRPLRLPPGFSLWLLFVMWAGLGILVVQSNAPLAVEGLNPNRYLTWGLRLFYYLVATIILLYVVNIRDRARFSRVLNAFAWMFVWIVAGGLLGTLLPGVDFPSPVELLLPSHLSGNAYVLSLIHPNLVEHALLTGTARPSAPFPYANVWGLNFACFLPCFVRSWIGSPSHRRRAVGVLILLASVVPVITSLNRGLWLALAAAVVTVVIRLAFERRAGLLIAMVGAVAVAVVLLAVTPLSGVISARLASDHNSNQGRTELATRGFTSTLASPVVGYGTARSVQGSLVSIAGGATSTCPRCSPPSFGTQGQLFLVTFTTGYVGGAFYIGFVLLMLIRGSRIRGPDVTMASAILVMHLSTMIVYSADNLAILPIFLALGVIGRELQLRQPQQARRSPWAVRALTAHPRVSVAVIACGALAGVAYHLVVPTPVTVSTSVIIPDGGQNGADDTTRFLPTSLDTLAQMVKGDTVVQAVGAATDATPDAVSRHLDVSAIPNTRIVNLLYTSTSPATARAGSLAAARALIQARTDQLASQQRVELHGTTTKVDLIGGVLQDYQRGLDVVQAHLLGPVTHNVARQMTIQQIAVTNAWESVEADRVNLLLDAPSNGDLALTPHAMAQPVSWGEPTANGLAGGVLLATGVGLTVPRRRRRTPGSATRTNEVNVKTSGRPHPARGSMYSNSGEARVARLEPRGLRDPEPVPARAAGPTKSTLRLGSVLLPVRRRWVSALMTFLVVVLLAGAYSMVHSPTYSSSTTVFLQPLTGNALATASSSNPTALTVAMETEASLASSHQVLDLAAQTLDRTPGPVSAIVPENTQIVRIRYTGTTPASAEAGATAVADAFLAFRTSQADASIQRQRSNIRQQITATKASLKKTLAQISAGTVSARTTVDVQLLTTRLSGLTDSLATVNALNTNAGSIVKAATHGKPPLLGRPVVELTGGVLLGLVAAFGVALLRERTDDRIQVGRLSSLGAVPILARIAASKDRNLSHFVDGLEPGHPIREAYRQARAGVLAGTSRPAVIAITTFAGAGPVSYAGGNLALALSEAGYRVRIVDASLEDQARQDFPVGVRVGLADHLVSKQLRELKLSRWHHVEMLPAGRDLGSVRDLFSSERMSGLLDRLSKVADYLVVLAPEASTSEAAALAGLADVTVLVGRDHHTTHTQVRDQISRYESLDGTVLGLIVLDQRASTGAAPATPVVSTADEPT